MMLPLLCCFKYCLLCGTVFSKSEKQLNKTYFDSHIKNMQLGPVKEIKASKKKPTVYVVDPHLEYIPICIMMFTEALW